MNEPVPIVYLVDDEPAVLKALSRLLRSSGFQVRTFDASQEFLDGHNPDAPGCLVLDLAMPGIDGLQLQEALARLGSNLPIVFLTGRGDVHTGVEAMKEGAIDFLTKPVTDEELIAAIGRALERNRLLRQARAAHARYEHRLAKLTPRERQVMVHVIAGKLNKQVAADLGTVEKTIKVHRARVMQKLGVGSLAELVRLAERAGIQPFDPTAPPLHDA